MGGLVCWFTQIVFRVPIFTPPSNSKFRCTYSMVIRVGRYVFHYPSKLFYCDIPGRYDMLYTKIVLDIINSNTEPIVDVFVVLQNIRSALRHSTHVNRYGIICRIPKSFLHSKSTLLYRPEVSALPSHHDHRPTLSSNNLPSVEVGFCSSNS